MGISIFPSTAAEFVSNNFVVDMNDTSNNTADTGGVKQAGPYSISFSSGDTSFDVYLIDNDGNSVGYSNNTSIVASGLFTTVVIFGVAQDEVVSFLYQGSVNNADGEGDEPGAGAYLDSLTPSDLPNIDDTTTVTGGNFGANTEITFESGATSLPAKNIVITSGTELIATRPDNLDPALDPWSLKAVNTGVPTPTTKDFVLTDSIDAGATPVWVTPAGSLDAAPKDQSYSFTLEATDADGSITYSIISGSLPTGLSLDSTTGVISGTPTTIESSNFTVRALDEGGNQNDRAFEIAVVLISGGTVTQENGYQIHTIEADETIEVFDASTTFEYLIAGGGGGGGSGQDSNASVGGGGGAGGLIIGSSTLAATTYNLTIGAGGQGGFLAQGFGDKGEDTVFPNVGTAIGGGRGAPYTDNAGDGGSGGGGGAEGGDGGSGTAGQGNAGGNGLINLNGAGGGGAGQAGFDGDGSSTTGNGGNGLQWSVDGQFYCGGGAGAKFNSSAPVGGLGGGGNANPSEANADFFGGGGASVPNTNDAGDGFQGVVKIAYLIP